MNHEERLDIMRGAEQIVKDVASFEGVSLNPIIEEGLIVSVKLHGLTQPGVYRLVAALANVEREAGRLPMKDARLNLE